MLKEVEEYCNLAVATIDGDQGWLMEVISIVLIVLIFNFLAKWVLKQLHYHFHKQKQHVKDSFVQALYAPLSYYVWFFALVHAIDLVTHRILNTSFLNDFHTWLKAGFVLALSWFFLRWKKSLAQIMTSRSKNHEIAMTQGKIDLLNKMVTMLILFMTILLLLEVTNRNVNTLIAFGGVGGLAIAFASQEIVANFFGGMMIYLTRPFTVGDWINLPERNIEGHVEDIGWYMTRIRTFEKRPIYIPNSIFSKMVVMTPSRMTHRQFKETFGLRYQDMPNVLSVIEGIKTILTGHTEIDQTQRIAVYLNALNTYSIDVIASCYTVSTAADDYARIKQNLFMDIYEEIARRGAQLAVPIHYTQST